MKGGVTPEHKVRLAGYRVMVVIDEAVEKIISGKCEDCAASAGKFKIYLVTKL